MQIKRQFTAILAGKENYNVCISDNILYEIKEKDTKYSKILFPLNKIVSIKIVKTQILTNQNYRFIVKINQERSALDILIEDKGSLQRFLKIIGNYSVVLGLQQMISDFKKIGEGSFAVVYEATTNYKSKFALKCFEKKGLVDEKVKKAYLNEIEVMKKLNNSHLLSFNYIFETDKAYYLQLEFFEKTLKERISQKMVIKDQKRFIKQLLIGLQEMKIKNIVHRDLKPENIMIRKNSKGQEECVIIDFGLATHVDSVPYLYFRCGTPGFLSPEIANLTNKKEKQQCSSDMFCLGCIFYKMLTGYYLFKGKTVKQVLQNNRKCQYSSSSFKSLSQKESNLLLKMLQLNPANRITPQDALKHPYFNEQIDDCDQIPEEECLIIKNLKKITNSQRLVKNMQSMNSFNSEAQISSMGSSIYKGKKQVKDSCLTFQFGSKINSARESNDSQCNMKASKESNRKKSILNTKRTDKMRQQSRFSKIGNINNI